MDREQANALNEDPHDLAPSIESLIAEGGELQGRYRLGALLQVGRRARIYEVEHLILRRPLRAAVTTIACEKEREDYLSAMSLVASVHASTFLDVYEALAVGEDCVVLFEVVQATSLAQARSSAGRWSAEEIRGWLVPGLRALGELHEMGLVHGRITSYSFCRNEEGVVQLGDLYALRESGPHVERDLEPDFELALLAPEWFVAGEDVGPQGDIYSVGALFYELLCGHFPVQPEGIQRWAHAHLYQVVSSPRGCRPEIDLGLELILLRALAKDPKLRFASAEAFAQALENWEQYRKPAPVAKLPWQLGGALSRDLVDTAGTQEREPARQEESEPLETPLRRLVWAWRWWHWLGVGVLALLLGGAAWLLNSEEESVQKVAPNPGQVADLLSLGEWPQERVLVSGGLIWLGVEPGMPGWTPQSLTPPIRVEVEAFAMDRYEVSVGRYRRCVEEGPCAPYPGHKQLDDDSAISRVSWREAAIYCEWRGGRLPTEAEWIRAARGSGGSLYPWGDRWSCGRSAAKYEGCEAPMVPQSVDFYGNDRSPFGVVGMAGGLWEWTADPWHERAGLGSGGAEGEEAEVERRVAKGGDWSAPARSIDERLSVAARGRSELGGFRCIRPMALDAPRQEILFGKRSSNRRLDALLEATR